MGERFSSHAARLRRARGCALRGAAAPGRKGSIFGKFRQLNFILNSFICLQICSFSHWYGSVDGVDADRRRSAARSGNTEVCDLLITSRANLTPADENQVRLAAAEGRPVGRLLPSAKYLETRDSTDAFSVYASVLDTGRANILKKMY